MFCLTVEDICVPCAKIADARKRNCLMVNGRVVNVLDSAPMLMWCKNQNTRQYSN